MLLPSQTAFGMTAGGGLDVKVSRHFAIRVIQAEYLMTGSRITTTGATGTQNDMRLSSGIVFRFGGNPGPLWLRPRSLSLIPASVNPTAVYRETPSRLRARP